MYPAIVYVSPREMDSTCVSLSAWLRPYLSRVYQGIVKVFELMKNGFVFLLLQSPRVHIERQRPRGLVYVAR
jgi:hypothetical protein